MEQCDEMSDEDCGYVWIGGYGQSINSILYDVQTYIAGRF